MARKPMILIYEGKEIRDTIIDILYTHNGVTKSTFGDYDTLHKLINTEETDAFRIKFKNEWVWLCSNKMNLYNEYVLKLTEKRIS